MCGLKKVMTLYGKSPFPLFFGVVDCGCCLSLCFSVGSLFQLLILCFRIVIFKRIFFISFLSLVSTLAWVNTRDVRFLKSLYGCQCHYQLAVLKINLSLLFVCCFVLFFVLSALLYFSCILFLCFCSFPLKLFFFLLV